MDNKKFIEDYKLAFCEKAVLPIAFWHSDMAAAVCTPWGSGCSTTIRQVIIEEEKHGSRCFIGLFDPSVRPRVRANELMFGIPKSRLEDMASFMRDTCLFNGLAWPKVKERIKDESTSGIGYEVT